MEEWAILRAKYLSDLHIGLFAAVMAKSSLLSECPCCWVLDTISATMATPFMCPYGQLCGQLIDTGPYVIAFQHIPLLQMNK